VEQPSLANAIRKYWAGEAARRGSIGATRALLAALWEFARNSTPWRLRQRYGDADYDWDYRVNTTSAALGWRDRLLGVVNSPYQPTEPALFREMIEALAKQSLAEQSSAGQTLAEHAQLDSGEFNFREFNFGEFTFVDLGSGKGRTLLMASDYPFRRIIGVELLPALHQIAQENLRQYKSDTQRCFALESICADAADFPLPEDPLVVYLFNPFPEAVLRQAVANLGRSVRAHPRAVYVLYHNPLLGHVLEESAVLRNLGGTDQFAIFRA
jgi:SAM-dependent methyltransferase